VYLRIQENNVKAIPILAGMVLASASVIAAEREPPINIIFSAESATCTAWLKSAGNKFVRQEYEIWAHGFTSGYNYGRPLRQVKVGAFPSGDDLYQYFDQYCRDHPQQSFVAGAIQLVEQLAEPTAPAKPAPVRRPPAKAPAAK
jgi:hypothetical protein